MAKKKRHNLIEIENKLREANALSAAGRTQSEIAKQLNVSVMTLHRWRKALPQSAHAENQTSRSHSVRLAELQLENARLRKLVTDLLLEKMGYEESRPREFENGPVTLKKA